MLRLLNARNTEIILIESTGTPTINYSTNRIVSGDTMPPVTINMKDTVVKATDMFNWITNHEKSRIRFSYIVLNTRLLTTPIVPLALWLV